MKANPNRPLMRELKKNWVEVFVGGRYTTRDEYAKADGAGPSP
jgi:hypothetical protein